MFREMRAQDRIGDRAEAKEALAKGEYGVLSLLGDDDYPYGVPLHYIADGETIYMHGFLEGHKIDALQKHSKASFTVVALAEIRQDLIDTNYISVIAFGKIDLVPMDDEAERSRIFKLFMKRFVPDDETRTDAYVGENRQATNLIRLKVEHLSCKKSAL